jgi:CDP-paratose 2-epimerase
MIVGAADVARANGKQVVLGGLSPIDPGFLVRMDEEGVLDAVDVVGVHGFPGTWEASWRGWDAELARVRQVTSKPLWITETGCARGGCVDRQVRALRSGAQAERMYWYSVFDLEPTRRSLKEVNLGVHDPREHRMGMGDPLRRELVAAAGLAAGVVAARRGSLRRSRAGARASDVAALSAGGQRPQRHGLPVPAVRRRGCGAQEFP